MESNKENILVPIDFTEKSTISIDQAVVLAKLIRAEITLLHIMQERNIKFLNSLFSEESEFEKMKLNYEDKCHKMMLKLAEEIQQKHHIKVFTMLAKGKVYEKVLEVSEQIFAKFIVVANNGEELDSENTNLGANTSKIIRGAQTPVITVNNKIFEKIENIVLPLDLTKQTRQKGSKAIELAKMTGATIRIVSAILTDDKEIYNRLKALMNQVYQVMVDKGVKCTQEFLCGDKDKDTVASIVVQYAHDINADMIMIMTQQEMNWLKFFLGSTAMEIIYKSEMPIMSITPRELELLHYR
ncbi:MAG: universal stress protein [Bacteroidota bacterium]